MALYVYVLFHETNSGHSEESDGYVEAIYASEQAAEAARLRLTREARERGEAIWCDPDNPEDDGLPDWEHDWTVIAYQVLSDEEAAHEASGV